MKFMGGFFSWKQTQLHSYYLRLTLNNLQYFKVCTVLLKGHHFYTISSGDKNENDSQKLCS